MEDENRWLKLPVTESNLHGEALETMIRKQVELAGLREKVAFVSAEFRLSKPPHSPRSHLKTTPSQRPNRPLHLLFLYHQL